METFTPLSPRARLLFHVQAFVRLALFWFPFTGMAVAGIAAVWSFTAAIAIGICFLFLRFLSAVWWPALSWSRWGYRLTDRELLITRGVLFRSVTAIPVTRVQHVDVLQGPFEQWLELARLQVHTASGLGADGTIPGLERPVAEALRDQLVRAEERGDDGV
jgi:membrane protein YdbS with pleckstrin-like domain